LVRSRDETKPSLFSIKLHIILRQVEFRDFWKFPWKSALVVVKKYSNMHYYNVLAETPQSLSIYYFPG
jgi:hypothetical protein